MIARLPTEVADGPSLTVDCVVFGVDPRGLSVLLIRRGIAPHRGKWALPGGFVRRGESLAEAAARELCEETGLKQVRLTQVAAFGNPGRDPRGHVVSIAFCGLVNRRDDGLQAATDASDTRWFAYDELPTLAFDHQSILDRALEDLQRKARYTPIGFDLLPKRFSLPQLQHVYESLLLTTLDKRNFRKKVISFGFIEETGEKEYGATGRPAALYRFNESRYRALEKEGLNQWV